MLVGLGLALQPGTTSDVYAWNYLSRSFWAGHQTLTETTCISKVPDGEPGQLVYSKATTPSRIGVQDAKIRRLRCLVSGSGIGITACSILGSSAFKADARGCCTYVSDSIAVGVISKARDLATNWE